MEFFTIGVYNSLEYDYFKRLVDNRIDTFCDIRQRRGVRGKKYSFVNSNRLQLKLIELDIKYQHVIELAPTTEIRKIQRSADKNLMTLKSERSNLEADFVKAYRANIMDHFDFNGFIINLKAIGAERIAIFCVEEKPEACHRSLVSDKLIMQGYKVTHL